MLSRRALLTAAGRVAAIVAATSALSALDRLATVETLYAGDIVVREATGRLRRATPSDDRVYGVYMGHGRVITEPSALLAA